MDIKKEARKYAIKNAFLHNGKADVKAVVGKLIALDHELSKNLSRHIKEITEEVDKVNAMGAEEIRKEFLPIEKTYELKPKEKVAGLKPIEWAEKGGKVVTRYAPNPNGLMHLGNARAALMSWEYAEKYKGKFILRFDDTDPKVKKPIENAEEIFREDLGWLGIKVGEVYFASDRLDIYQKHMEKLIEKGKAYVCICDVEEWREKITKGNPCECRERNPEKQMKLFEDMKSGKIKEGKAVLRLKTDLKSKDPSLRDWWMAKVVNSPEHPGAGKNVHLWPSYNFASAIDDHELGVTLIIRGQEHAQNAEKQGFVYGYLGWDYPDSIHTGRIKLEKMVLSTSKTREGIERGEYSGWDDPRLGTLKALRRRGFQAKTLREILEEIGVKSSDTTVTMKALIAVNKKYVDEKAERFAFMEEPMKLKAEKCKKMRVGKPVHPDFPEKGERDFELKEGVNEFWIPKSEVTGKKRGDKLRMRHAFNVRVETVGDLEAEAEFIGERKADFPVLSWIKNEVQCEVLMPDNLKKHGIIDAEIQAKKEGQIVFLERFGYARIDSLKEKIVLVYAHE